MTKKQFNTLVQKHSPKTKKASTCAKAFAIGGAICVIGQGLFELFGHLGFDRDKSGAMASMTLIAAAALMTGAGLYDKLAKHGGAGTLVPITGFANAVVAPALEFKTEGFIYGVGAKMFSIAGPVLVYGIAASGVYGVVHWLLKMQ
ncbi:MAG: stage V sporulation protein AC [Oscillospiraceae bacterium]|nr:stage V sporulation protein AC [Oscillospiraceae bacterium]